MIVCTASQQKALSGPDRRVMQLSNNRHELRRYFRNLDADSKRQLSARSVNKLLTVLFPRRNEQVTAQVLREARQVCAEVHGESMNVFNRSYLLALHAWAGETLRCVPSVHVARISFSRRRYS